jgi:hypothetical protein
MEKQIISDDSDQRPATCEMLLGGNGDYYIVVKEEREGIITANSCRVSTSGGNSNLKVKIAVANLYRAVENGTSDTDHFKRINHIDKVMADLFHNHDYRAMYEFYNTNIKPLI